MLLANRLCLRLYIMFFKIDLHFQFFHNRKEYEQYKRLNPSKISTSVEKRPMQQNLFSDEAFEHPVVEKQSFEAFAKKLIERKQGASRFMTATNYRTALRSFHTFLGYSDIAINEIDHRLIEDYERWLKNRRVVMNTISCYMRALRAIYNVAVEDQLVQQTFPFRKVYTGSSKTKKRSIDIETIKKLQLLQLPENSYLTLLRDVFLFSFYACGMPFVDIAYLRKSQINDGYLTYSRHKTHQQVRILLEPCMVDIIERYRSEARDYVFPFLFDTDNSVLLHTRYRSKIRSYNAMLKVLEQLCDIKVNLTSYVARHSWASLAYQSNIELPLISKGLGHTNPRTTLVYVREVNDRTFEVANHQLLKKVLVKDLLDK